MNSEKSGAEHVSDPEDVTRPYGRLDGDSETGSSFEQTMPPGTFDALLSAGGAGILVLSTDDKLLATIRRISGEHHSIVAFEEWPDLAAALDDGRGGIVLLDMDRVGDGLDKRITDLERHRVRPVIVAAASLSAAPEPMRALAERRIHRLLVKPASLGNTRLLIEAAINRWQQLHEPQEIVAPELPRPRLAPRDAAAVGRRRGLMLGIGMALVLGVVVAVGLMRSPDRSPPSPESEAQAPTEAPQSFVGEVRRDAPRQPVAEEAVADPWAEQLASAQSAFEAGRLAEPPGDNALDGFAAILAADPGHAEARAGLDETIDVLFVWAESALLGNAPELAATTLEQVRRVQPDSPRLAFLEVQLERMQAQQAAAPEVRAPPQQPVVVAPPSELDSLLAIAQSRIQRGQLLEPENDSAQSYYARAAAIDGDDARVVAMRGALTAALIAAARQLLDAGELAQADPLITRAGELGANPAVLAELDGRLGAAHEMQQAERENSLLELGRERLYAGRLIAPESDSAAYYLSTLRAQNPNHPELAEPWRALTMTLAANVREGIAAADWNSAQSWLTALERIDADPALARTLARELTVTRRQAEFLGNAVPAQELTLVEFQPPAYPAAAQRSGVEGWVELEFIVGRDGRPREIVVAAAQPAGRFDQSATEAVSQYRYEPVVVEGVTYERRVRLRIRFALE